MSINKNPTPSVSLDAFAIGRSSTSAFLTVFETRNPNSGDVSYPVQQRWFNTVEDAEWILVGYSVVAEVKTAIWELISNHSTVVETLTANSGGAVGVDAANNIFVVGDTTTINIVGNPATHTLIASAGINGFPITPYVVGPVGQAGYQTIQSGINAAQAAGGGVVGVQPGTYTENLTLFSNCHITGLTFADAGGGVTIIGVHTPPTSGGFVFNNVALQSATDIFNSTAAGTAHLIIANAAITVTNGYTFNLLNWTGKLEIFDVNDRASTNDGFVNNTGGATLAFFEAAIGAGTAHTMTCSGAVSIFNCAIGCPINCVTGANVFFELNVHLNPITFSNNSTGEITLCEVDAQVTMNSSAAVLIASSIINTASNPAVAGSGAGTLSLNEINFINNHAIANTLTLSITGGFYPPGNVGSTGEVWTSNGPGVCPTFQPISASGAIQAINIQTISSTGTYTPTANMSYCIIEVLGAGGGGGGTPSAPAGQALAAGGGGGGGYARGVFTAATIGASQAVTIGAGGTGASAGNNAGSSGGSTSVGALISATGGGGGAASGANNMSATGGIGTGGAGGTGTGGQLQSIGAPGGTGTIYFNTATGNFAAAGGIGGSTYLGGGGGSGIASGANGNNGSSEGGGGSGGGDVNATSARSGGNGFAGLVIIQEYIT